MMFISRSALWVLLSGTLILMVTVGIRQSFGIFLEPITLGMSLGRQEFGLALAVQNLVWGLVQPLVGALADRFGTVRLTIVGLLCYGLGLYGMSMSTDVWGLVVWLGIFVGLGLSTTTYVTIIGQVGRIVPVEKRALVFGLCTSAGSFGMFAVVPGVQELLNHLGWIDTVVCLVGLLCLLIPVAFGLSYVGEEGVRGCGSLGSGSDISLRVAISCAGNHRGYWLLNFGFFVCGFHIAFIATHLPVYLMDHQLSATVNAWALAMIGLFNILGSYFFGYCGTLMRQKYVLCLLYLARAVVIGLFLVLPVTGWSALVFGGLIGFLWLGTIPLTSGLVAHLFGTRYLSMLYGFVFLFHQVGSFFGAWGGGVVFDVLGSYDLLWLLSIGLAIFAVVVHALIDDTPVVQLANA